MLGLRERMEENGSAPGTGEAKRSAAAPADPEVVDRPLRRRFSPSYKLRIVEEADRCTEPGEVGQVLRREGLYSSHLTTWRKAGLDVAQRVQAQHRESTWLTGTDRGVGLLRVRGQPLVGGATP